MKTIILYSTQTGNTKKVAETIFKINPFEKAIIPIDQLESQVSLDDYDLILIGYWVENSQANSEALSIMEQLRNKQVILFVHPELILIIVMSERFGKSQSQLWILQTNCWDTLFARERSLKR